MHRPGEPFKGILSDTDVSTATAVPIFLDGSNDVYTLGEDEYLEVDNIELVYVTGGDVHLFVGADGTPGAGETIARGDVGANGGIVDQDMNHVGLTAHTLWVQAAAAGQVDVKVHGRIRRRSIGRRPEWREAQTPT